MQPKVTIVEHCAGLLEQVAGLIEQLDNGVFATTTPLSPRGSIGGHLRHILDFYESFLIGLELNQIDYSRRQRDPRVENDRDYALRKIKKTVISLRRLTSINLQADLLVSTEDDCVNARKWSKSSVLRELDFLHSHTIHHYSLIAILLRQQAIDPGDEFGVAPSTLRYWREEAAVCAQ